MKRTTYCGHLIKRYTKWLLAIPVLLLTIPMVSAQDTEEPVFELSPFEVDGSGDIGYTAAATLTGSRLNTRLEDVAASVSVFTEEFINDTGLDDMQEIIRYSVGSINNFQDINSGPNINNYLGAANSIRRVRIRGIRATKGLDYFQAYIPDDSYRSGRYDESRGPNGILFGISEAGGILNTTPLRANTQVNSGRIRYSFGSYQRNRIEGRINSVIVKNKLGITLAGVGQNSGGWRDHEKYKRDRYYAAVKWTPSDRLTIQAWGESGNIWGTRMRDWNAAERFLPWYLVKNRFGLEAAAFVPGNGSTTLGVRGTRDGDSPSSSSSALESIIGVDNNNVSRNVSFRRKDVFTTPNPTTGRRYVYVQNDGSFYNSAETWESESFEDPNVASMETILNATSLADISAAGRAGGGNEWRDAAIILDAEGYDYSFSQWGFPYPTHLNASGPDSYRAEDFDTWTVMADYRITDNLFFNIAHNHQQNFISGQYDSGSRPQLRGDPNWSLRNEEVANDMGLDPDIPNPWVGELYFESEWRYQEHWIDYDETRAALSWDLDFSDMNKDWLGRHRLAAGYTYREMSDHLRGYDHAFLGNPYDSENADDFDDNRNKIYVRNYITEGDFSTYVAASPMVPGGETIEVMTEEGITRKVGWVTDNPGTINARSDIEVTSKILAMQNSFWNDRIVTTFGWREDEADNVAFGHVRDPEIGFVITEDPEAPGYRPDKRITAITKTAGVVFKLTDEFSLLANWATSIGLPEFRNIVFPGTGIADPVQGEGYDVGIGFNLMDNRISGRVVYFDGEAINRTSSGGGTRIISDPMWQSLRAMDWLREDYPDIIRNPDTGQPYSDSEWESEINALNGASGDGVSSTPFGRVNAFLQNEYTEGWEVSLTANITNNWRLTLNGSYTDRILLDYGHKFAESAGFQKGDDGRWIQAVDASRGDRAHSVDLNGKLAAGSIHQRILEIAQAAQGTIPLFDDDDDVVIGEKIIDPNASTITITEVEGQEVQWVGPGALIINTDSGDTVEESDDFNWDETVAYRLWESQDQLQLNNDEREKRWGLNPWKFNVWTSYDFDEGWLDGWTVGGGYRYLGGTILGTEKDNDDAEIKGPSQSYFDLQVKYTQKLKKGHRIEYQVNVYNVFNRTDPLPVRWVNLGEPSLPLARAKLIEPTTVRFTITYSF
ncbi:MAG: TonB-dependent receptor [Puniceicoccaceae bacterium]